MSIDSAIHALSGFNVLMGSINGYNRDKQDGVPANEALFNMGQNMLGGTLRNQGSREILHSSGSYLGYALNNAIGYDSPEATAQGINATINAAMLTSPYGLFGGGYFGGGYMHNPWMTSSIYGCGPYGGGYFGGGCGCAYNSPFIITGPTMFGRTGFWC